MEREKGSRGIGIHQNRQPHQIALQRLAWHPSGSPGTWHAYSRLRTGEVKKQESKEVRVDLAWEVCSELGSPACASLVLKMLEWHDHDGQYSGQRERYVTRSGLGNPIPSIFHSLNVMKFLSALNDQGCVPPCHTSSQRDWRCSWFAHRQRQLPTSQSSNISDKRAAAITWTTTFVPLNWCHPRKNSIATKQIYNPWVGYKTHELAQHHAFLRLFICCSQEVAWTPDRSAQSCLDLIQSPPSCSLQN